MLLAARTQTQLDDVAGQIVALGRRAHVVVADLSDLDAVADLATQAEQAFGRLDIVVNNVGGTIPNAFLDTTPEYLAQAFSFNVLTAHSLTRAAVPLMLAGDGGSVVNISSVMGRTGGAATWRMAPRKRAWPTTAAWRPAISRPVSASMPSPSDRLPRPHSSTS